MIARCHACNAVVHIGYLLRSSELRAFQEVAPGKGDYDLSGALVVSMRGGRFVSHLARCRGEGDGE